MLLSFILYSVNTSTESDGSNKESLTIFPLTDLYVVPCVSATGILAGGGSIICCH